MKIGKEESVKNSGRQRSLGKNNGVWDPKCKVEKNVFLGPGTVH